MVPYKMHALLLEILMLFSFFFAFGKIYSINYQSEELIKVKAADRAGLLVVCEDKCTSIAMPLQPPAPFNIPSQPK